MDPFTLKEALHRATMPFEYVHRAESRRLEREEDADKIWAWSRVEENAFLQSKEVQTVTVRALFRKKRFHY